MNAITECYAAFAVSISRGCGVEDAFSRLYRHKQGNLSHIPEEDLPWLIEQRKMGVTYKELGKKYGVSAGSVHVFMKRRGALEYVLNWKGEVRVPKS